MYTCINIFVFKLLNEIKLNGNSLNIYIILSDETQGAGTLKR